MPQTMKEKPFFSIVTVTLNNLPGLKTTKKSIEDQRFRDFEWIIIDGASDDGTPDHLEKTTARWTSAPDNGIYDAMNKGLRESCGQYVLFLNAGDALAGIDVLKTLRENMNGEDFVYGDSFERLENGQTLFKPARKPHIENGMFTHHQAMLYRRDALKDMSYNERYKIAADYDLTARLLARSKSVLYVPLPICIFESGGISQTKATLGRAEQFQIRKNLKLCSSAKNAALYGVQTGLWAIRTRAPALYWLLKSSRNKAGGSSQIKTLRAHPKTRA